jgi:hypothetical protein
LAGAAIGQGDDTAFLAQEDYNLAGSSGTHLKPRLGVRVASDAGAILLAFSRRFVSFILK